MKLNIYNPVIHLLNDVTVTPVDFASKLRAIYLIAISLFLNTFQEFLNHAFITLYVTSESFAILLIVLHAAWLFYYISHLL
jgi:hypothetical protein